MPHGVMGFAVISVGRNITRDSTLPKQSKLEAEMAFQLRAAGIRFKPEIRFYDKRKWRFDFVLRWNTFKHGIALEVEGGTWSGGRHTTGAGFEKDCEKYNQAAILGWRVLRVTGPMIKDGRALATAERALNEAT